MMEAKKLKILHITAMYPSKSTPTLGGFVKSQIDSLNQYGDNEITIIQGLKGLGPYLLAIPKILKKIYFSEFDVIHIHYGNLSSLVKLLYWGNVPIVTSYCGDDLFGTVISQNKYSIKSLFFKRLNIFLARWDSCSIVKSQGLADKIKKAKRVEIVPNGVDVNKFYPMDKIDARKNLGLVDSKKIVILFPADPGIPRKNFKLLQTVLSDFEQNDFELLTFAGSNIRHEDTPYYFNAADIVVFTSLYEGSPNVIKEAMACNCKIYSTDCGDVAWLLKDVTGSKVLSYNIFEWKSNLTDFLNCKNSIGSNSRNKLQEDKLDIQSIAKRIFGIYYAVSNNNI